MKLATCRPTLACLLIVLLSGGCANLKPWKTADLLPAKRKSADKSSEKITDATLTAGLPKLGSIRMQGPLAERRRRAAAARNSSSIKQRAEESRLANKRKPEDKTESAKSSGKSLERSSEKSFADKAADPPAIVPEVSPELAGFDQTTQALIQSELRDANPEERAELLNELKSVSADMVPRILSIRRAALNYKTQQSKISPTGGLVDKQEKSSSPRYEELSPPAESLGNKNSWTAGYAPPPVGSDSAPTLTSSTVTENISADAARTAQNSPPQNHSAGPAFPAANLSAQPSQNFAANPANTTAMSPEQLAAQVLASTASIGIPANNQTPAFSNNMIPAQSMGMLGGNPLAGAIPGPQGMIPLASSNQINPFATASQQSPLLPQTPANTQQIIPVLTSPNPQLMQPIATSVPANPSLPQSTTAQQFASNPAIPDNNSTTIPVSFNPNTTPSPSLPAAQNATNGWVAGALPNYSTLPATAHSPHWQQHLQGLIAAAESETAGLTPGTTDQEKQRYIEAHVQLRMLYMMAGQQQRALAHIPGIDPADQEFWQQVMWGTTNYFDVRQIPATADRATQTVAQFQAASSRLREKANLELRGLNFCTQINGFGDLEKFPSGNEFSAGQRVLIYAEIVNFKSDLSPDGRYHSRLKPTYEILRPGGQGEVVEQKSFSAIEDVCNNHRQDFYLHFTVDIPEKISLGPHVLRLTVEDELSRKLATQTLNFTIK